MMIAAAGCRGPTSPSELNGAMPVNETIQTDGSFTLFVEMMKPGRGTTAPVGADGLLWANLTNTNSELHLVYRIRVVDSPSDSGPGRSSPIFGGCCGWSSIEPSGRRTGMMGYRSSVAEVIPWLRFEGCHSTNRSGFCAQEGTRVMAHVYTGWTFQ